MRLLPLTSDRRSTAQKSTTARLGSKCCLYRLAPTAWPELFSWWTLASQEFKMDVQRGQTKEAPEAYPLGYVEDASKSRTKLAADFNILLSRQPWDFYDRPDLNSSFACH